LRGGIIKPDEFSLFDKSFLDLLNLNPIVLLGLLTAGFCTAVSFALDKCDRDGISLTVTSFEMLTLFSIAE
jgi:hypothetical protein